MVKRMILKGGNMRNLKVIFLLILMVLTSIAYSQDKKPKKIERLIKPDMKAEQRIEIAMQNKDKAVSVSEKDVFLIETSKGKIKIKLLPKAAPKTAENFARLALLGFYDGLIFHRYVEDFVIQGGDPTGTGRGNAGYTVPLEANAAHDEGAVGLARGPDKDSGSCQFYITLSPQHGLDGNYTVFGKVIEGMDIVKKLRVGDSIIKIDLIK